jgi:hypothetical protein
MRKNLRRPPVLVISLGKTARLFKLNAMRIKYLPVVLVCAFLALWPKAEAVVPPPDGGYLNFTTAAGDHALQALTLGVGNTAIGTFSCLASPLAASTPLLALERLI